MDTEHYSRVLKADRVATEIEEVFRDDPEALTRLLMTSVPWNAPNGRSGMFVRPAEGDEKQDTISPIGLVNLVMSTLGLPIIQIELEDDGKPTGRFLCGPMQPETGKQEKA